MRGRHRRPTTVSTTLRAPLSEWVRDAWTVVVNTLSPTAAPATIGVDTRIPDRVDSPEADIADSTR